MSVRAAPTNGGLYIPTKGMYCVPTALEIITGEDPRSVLFPSLNRYDRSSSLIDPVAGIGMSAARRVLEELGWMVREYRGKRPLGALVSSWAKRFPDHTILIAAGGRGERHCLVLRNGNVYDSWEPMGVPADFHPFNNTKVRWAAIVQRSR